MRKGFFITFEGPEGCGKTTQVKLLAGYLKAKGYKVRVTREPGGTRIGQEIRQLLLNTKAKMDHLAEVFLFMADRREHVAEVVLPHLKKGYVVISDRYSDSTMAYQVGGRGLPRKMVKSLCDIASQGIVPNITFLLDVPSELGLKRVDSARYVYDRFESELLAFHRRVRKAFLNIAAKEKKRIKVIDTRISIKEVQENITKIIDKELK
ncbi:MAG: dTMP kinase [bacterium]